MKEKSINRAKLGAFVLMATTFLVLGLYYIGSQRNIFHTTINVSADFNNVGGLTPGNNVRFNGINVGTVSNVYPVSDTAIKVEFTIDEALTKYITQDAITSIGTDGLLGNKLINIAPGQNGSRQVREGDVLKAVNPLQMDNTLRTLTLTSDNLKAISDNLKAVSEKINNDNSLWHLLADTVLAESVQNAVVHFELTGTNAAVITGNLSGIVRDIKSGKGSIGALLTDTLFSSKLDQTIVNIKAISDSVAFVSGDFRNISEKLKSGSGSIATLLTDTSFVHNLNQSMKNIEKGSDNFNENMEALKHSWPFKKYFKRKK